MTIQTYKIGHRVPAIKFLISLKKAEGWKAEEFDLDDFHAHSSYTFDD